MGVARGQERARDRDGIVHRRALADSPVVDVTAHPVGWNGIDDVGFGGRQAEHPEVRSDGDAHVLQHPVLFLHGLVVHGHARVIDDLVHDAEGSVCGVHWKL